MHSRTLLADDTAIQNELILLVPVILAPVKLGRLRSKRTIRHIHEFEIKIDGPRQHRSIVTHPASLVFYITGNPDFLIRIVKASDNRIIIKDNVFVNGSHPQVIMVMLTRKRHVICCSPARIKVLITFEFTIIRTALRPIQFIGVKSLRTVNHDLVSFNHSTYPRINAKVIVNWIWQEAGIDQPEIY